MGNTKSSAILLDDKNIIPDKGRQLDHFLLYPEQSSVFTGYYFRYRVYDNANFPPSNFFESYNGMLETPPPDVPTQDSEQWFELKQPYLTSGYFYLDAPPGVYGSTPGYPNEYAYSATPNSYFPDLPFLRQREYTLYPQNIVIKTMSFTVIEKNDLETTNLCFTGKYLNSTMPEAQKRPVFCTIYNNNNVKIGDLEPVSRSDTKICYNLNTSITNAGKYKIKLYQKSFTDTTDKNEYSEYSITKEITVVDADSSFTPTEGALNTTLQVFLSPKDAYQPPLLPLPSSNPGLRFSLKSGGGDIKVVSSTITETNNTYKLECLCPALIPPGEYNVSYVPDRDSPEVFSDPISGTFTYINLYLYKVDDPIDVIFNIKYLLDASPNITDKVTSIDITNVENNIFQYNIQIYLEQALFDKDVVNFTIPVGVIPGLYQVYLKDPDSNELLEQPVKLNIIRPLSIDPSFTNVVNFNDPAVDITTYLNFSNTTDGSNFKYMVLEPFNVDEPKKYYYYSCEKTEEIEESTDHQYINHLKTLITDPILPELVKIEKPPSQTQVIGTAYYSVNYIDENGNYVQTFLTLLIVNNQALQIQVYNLSLNPIAPSNLVRAGEELIIRPPFFDSPFSGYEDLFISGQKVDIIDYNLDLKRIYFRVPATMRSEQFITICSADMCSLRAVIEILDPIPLNLTGISPSSMQKPLSDLDIFSDVSTFYSVTGVKLRNKAGAITKLIPFTVIDDLQLRLNLENFNDFGIEIVPGEYDILVYQDIINSDAVVFSSLQIDGGVVVCFKDDTKIRCLVDNEERDVEIKNMKIGTLVKTLCDGYLPVKIIGKSTIDNLGDNSRIKDRMYILSKEKYPELEEDLYLTGCHSILVDDLSDKEKNKIIEDYRKLYITDGKYRLPVYIDERSEPYNYKNKFEIYHLALFGKNKYVNHGIYAHGLLVETCFEERIKSKMNLV
jgi:hypothetical protein